MTTKPTPFAAISDYKAALRSMFWTVIEEHWNTGDSEGGYISIAATRKILSDPHTLCAFIDADIFNILQDMSIVAEAIFGLDDIDLMNAWRAFPLSVRQDVLTCAEPKISDGCDLASPRVRAMILLDAETAQMCLETARDTHDDATERFILESAPADWLSAEQRAPSLAVITQKKPRAPRKAHT